MIVKFIAIAFVATALAGPAFAEGNADPFGFRADGQVGTGRAIAGDVGSQAYPSFIGAGAGSSLAGLEPSLGSEAAVQTANALPGGTGHG